MILMGVSWATPCNTFELRKRNCYPYEAWITLSFRLDNREVKGK